MAEALSLDGRVLFAYVYGSVLRRKDPRDVDVAVYLQGRRDPWLGAQGLAAALEGVLGRVWRVDVHALNAAAPAFAFRVLADGRLLWERDAGKRKDWEAHVLSRYQDIKPMLDFHDRRFLAR